MSARSQKDSTVKVALISTVGLIVVALISAGVTMWVTHHNGSTGTQTDDSDKAAIRDVIKNSQHYETFTLDRNPKAVAEDSLLSTGCLLRKVVKRLATWKLGSTI